jgi:hypothetical protein
MLKQKKIRSEIKEALILLAYSGLLIETLTNATVLFVFLGSLLIWLRIHPATWIRNLIALALFIVYWFTYGKIIDPEVGLNFLTSIIVMKMLEKDSERDQYMIFFGLILLISAGALFQKSLSYVLFFTCSFLVLIQDFYGHLRLPAKIQNILQLILWILPFTMLIFIFAPRIMSPFQIESGAPKEGEIGYTPEVNISNIESLSSNTKVVFQAQLFNTINMEQLYWRGNTLSFSDGWNWPLMPQDKPQKNYQPEVFKKNNLIKQKIKVFASQEFYFGLDFSQIIKSSEGEISLDSFGALAQNRWRPISRYEVFSDLSGIASSPNDSEETKMHTGLSQTEETWVLRHFKSTNLDELKKEIRDYFSRAGFSYSLSPGRVTSFLSFMEEKKVGFCSHYASSVALILRAKKIKTRLVSGFLGGKHLPFANVYQVSQNDAHVWVEAFKDGLWHRIDPTEWIAPNRIMLGGEAFLQSTSARKFSLLNYLSSKFGRVYEIQQWLTELEFKFNQFLENMDYDGQLALFQKYFFKKEWLFSLLPGLVALFMALYAWQVSRVGKWETEQEKLWRLFRRKMNKRGLDFALYSVMDIENKIHSQDQRVKEAWRSLVVFSFSPQSELGIKEIKKKIRNL